MQVGGDPGVWPSDENRKERERFTTTSTPVERKENSPFSVFCTPDITCCCRSPFWPLPLTVTGHQSLPPLGTGYTMSSLPSSRSAPVGRQNCRQENPELKFPFFRASGPNRWRWTYGRFYCCTSYAKRWALTMALFLFIDIKYSRRVSLKTLG